MSNYTFDRQSIIDGTKMHNFPINVIVETSSYCNLKCAMCVQPMMKRPKGNMDFNLFKKIVDEISGFKPSTTLWLALLGEPLMNPEQLIDMVYYAKQKGLKDVRLNTNGLLLTQDIIDQLVVADLDYVLISVDAFKPETYEKIRIGGNLDKLAININRLLNAKKITNSKIKIVTQFIVMEENENEVEDFKKYWLNQGSIVKIRPKLSWGNTIKADNLNLTQEDRVYPCPWLMRTMSIHWTGRLAQCDFDYEDNYSPGDANKQSLKEIWNGEIYKRRMKHCLMDFSHPLCKECKDWQVGRSIFYGN